MEQIIPTSLAIIALVSLFGVTAATINGSINWIIAAPFEGESILGMLSGRFIAKKLQGPLMLRIFSIFALSVAFAMVLKVIY